MECYFCKMDLKKAELNSLLPLKRNGETVYACVKHHGIQEEYNRQNGIKEQPKA